MDKKYRAVRIQEYVEEELNKTTLAGWKDTEVEAEAMVRKNIAADMKNANIVMAANLVLCSDGNIGLKNYFTNDMKAERDYFVEVSCTWYTEESGKAYHQSYVEYDNKREAEAKYWDETGTVRSDADVDVALNVVFNRHGGTETSQNQSNISLKESWVQYPEEPEPEPSI